LPSPTPAPAAAPEPDPAPAAAAESDPAPHAGDRRAPAPAAVTRAVRDRKIARKTEPQQNPAGDPVDAYARGVTQLARGDERGALEAFRAYLHGASLLPARRAEAERYAIALQRKFGEIEVACDLPGADVLIDGRFVGRTPLPRSLLLDPGPHELMVLKSGYNPVRKPFHLAPGERQPFFLRLPR
jgi:hypothetical protein